MFEHLAGISAILGSNGTLVYVACLSQPHYLSGVEEQPPPIPTSVKGPVLAVCLVLHFPVLKNRSSRSSFKLLLSDAFTQQQGEEVIYPRRPANNF